MEASSCVTTEHVQTVISSWFGAFACVDACFVCKARSKDSPAFGKCIHILSPHHGEAKAGGSEASKEPMAIYILRSVVVGA